MENENQWQNEHVRLVRSRLKAYSDHGGSALAHQNMFFVVPSFKLPSNTKKSLFYERSSPQKLYNNPWMPYVNLGTTASAFGETQTEFSNLHIINSSAAD